MNGENQEKLIPLKDIPKSISEFDIKEIEDLSSRVKDIEKKVDEINKSTERAEKRANTVLNFTWTMVSGIAVAFFIALILISLDYFNNNEGRYEKFLDKAREIEIRFYTKDELKPKLENNDKNSEILSCIKNKGYFSIQCFK